MRLETDLGTWDNVSPNELVRHLNDLNLDNNTRAILSRANEVYMQTAVFENGYVLEKRDGSKATHQHAIHLLRTSPLEGPPERQPSWWQKLLGLPPMRLTHQHAFTQDEMRTVFMSYLTGEDQPQFLRWERGYS